LTIFRLSRTYRTARRLQQVINVFLRHGFGAVIDQIHLGRYIPFLKRIRSFGQWPQVGAPGMAARIRTAFAELGPSFIKLAQLLSTRPDLLGAKYADEFRKLQDEVPPFPAEEAEVIIAEDLMMPMEKAFKEFWPEPIAAASIAQVHRARLPDGTDVVVKVQRPDIHKTLEIDIDILKTIANLLETHVPESRNFNPMGIVQEFERNVLKELQFIEEAKNACRFRKNFENRPSVYIPQIFQEYVGDRVLVMERVEGVRIDDLASIETMGYDPKEIARIGVDAYFKMIFEDGFFHADPHPGNLFVLPDGRISFVDFGIVGRVNDRLKAALANTFVGLVQQDFDRLIDQYVEMGVVPEEMDTTEFRREFKSNLEDFLTPVLEMKIGEIDFSAYLEAYIRFAVKYGMRLPQDLMLIDKVILILQDVGKRLDPQFDFMSASEPYVRRLIRERYEPGQILSRATENIQEAVDFVTLFPKQMKKLMRKVIRDDLHMKLSHTGLEKLIKDMDRSSNRISFSLVISSILISSAIFHATGVGPTIFGLSLLGLFAFGFASVLGVWLIISILRSGRM
jgi:ubiquinone biosynthesis protein